MADLSLYPLPFEAEMILRAQNAPPRLLAHLTLVHDVATRMLDALTKKWPTLRFNREHVLLSAALHDIGKIIHPRELTGPGKQHESEGERLLLELGVDASIARIARTHGQPPAALELEDLLVKVSDTIWKGKRDESLESLLVEKISAQTDIPNYTLFMGLDSILTKLANRADARLAWQASHSE